MNIISCSPYDPIFWLHHTFIDCNFEWWRATHSTSVADYPRGSDIYATDEWNKTALPFGDTTPPTWNSDCLTTKYDGLYTCVKPPTTCTTDANCGPGMWCRTTVNPKKCYSKIRRDGACGNFGAKACYQEPSCTTTVQCTAGKCKC